MYRTKIYGLWLLAIVAAATGFVSSPAAAAELHLTGPDGAVVMLDDAMCCTLPLDGPLTIATGRHELTSTLSGAHPIDREVSVADDGEVIRLHLRFMPLNRLSAVGSSLLLAGSGQRYEGRSRLGAVLTGAEVIGLVTALASELQVRNARDDYLVAVDAYDDAVAEIEIRQWRETAEVKHDDMTSAADRRDLGLALAAGAVAVSMLDAWLRFPALDAGLDLNSVGPADIAAGSAGVSPRAHIALTLNF